MRIVLTRLKCELLTANQKHLISACSVCVYTQSCPTLCDPMDCSPPGSPVYGIFQARIQEHMVISYSTEFSQPRDWTHISCDSCIGKWIHYHCATWKPGPNMYFMDRILTSSSSNLLLWLTGESTYILLERNLYLETDWDFGKGSHAENGRRGR